MESRDYNSVSQTTLGASFWPRNFNFKCITPTCQPYPPTRLVGTITPIRTMFSVSDSRSFQSPEINTIDIWVSTLRYAIGSSCRGSGLEPLTRAATRGLRVFSSCNTSKMSSHPHQEKPPPIIIDN